MMILFCAELTPVWGLGVRPPWERATSRGWTGAGSLDTTQFS